MFVRGHTGGTGRNKSTKEALLYGSVALGLVAGVALSTYLWRQRTRTLELLSVPPLERAEQLISNCESKLESIERAIADLKTARS